MSTRITIYLDDDSERLLEWLKKHFNENYPRLAGSGHLNTSVIIRFSLQSLENQERGILVAGKPAQK